MERVAPAAASLSGGLAAVSRALDEYAVEVDALTTKHTSLAVDAGVLERAITADADWRSDSRLVARQQQLEQAVGSLSRAFAEARERCVSAIESAETPAVHTAGQAGGPPAAPGTGDGGTAGAPWDPRHLFWTSSFDSMTPTEVNAWWTSLSPAAQATYLASQPRLVGGLDGIPAAVRDAANRSRLDREHARLTAERDALSYFERNVSKRTLSDELNEKIDATAAIRDALGLSSRQLLLFDVSGREALAAVAVGDVDSAKNVTVLVGGTGTNVETGLEKIDGDAAALRERVTDISEHRGSDVAVVSYLGYRAPSALWLAHKPYYAVDGREPLMNFLDGISTTSIHDPADLNLVLGGHSYGALLATGAVMDDSTPVDAVATYGTPGIVSGPLGEGVEKYWLANSDDPIRGVAVSGWYTDQPNVDDGWQELHTAAHTIGDRTYWRGVDHNYLVDGTMTQYNLAALSAGRPDLLVHYDGSY